MYENIKYEVNEGLAIVTINRPKAMNALNMDVLSELRCFHCYRKGRCS